MIAGRGLRQHCNPMGNFALSPDAKAFIPRNLKSGGGGKQPAEEEHFCPYYAETGSCLLYLQGACPLIHGEYCEFCCRFCLNPFDKEQQKSHKHACVEEHERQMKKAFANQQSQDKTCGICMENIWEQAQRFGILNKCKHCYCLRCIRAWRKTTGPVQKETTRSCPQCRVVSDFVVPSELWVEEDAEKEALIRQYQQNMKQKVCKYVKNDNADDCPFGNKCFYRHQRQDGSLIVTGPPRRRQRSREDYQNMSLEEFIRLVPNVNLVRVGIGEEDNVGMLFEELRELFGDSPTYNFMIHDEFDDDMPTDDEEDEVDEDELDDELFDLRLDDEVD